VPADLALVPDLPDADLDALEQAVEQGLTAAVASLTRLRELHAHTRRGFERWHLYVFDRFGDLLALLRLPDEERRALIASMSTPAGDHGKPVPVREQARLLGIAVNTVQADREALGLRVVKDRPEPLPAPAGKVWQQAAEHLRRAGDRGLTLVELAAVAKWTEGKASGALTDVRRHGLAQRTEDRRAGQRVHLATEADQ
jgi:hypothetical protein